MTSENLPTLSELENHFLQKYGPVDTVGWSPRRRFRFGYFLPADIYECLTSKLVVPGSDWLDVGGGHAIFPENPGLATELVSRCNRVVAVDPSENVQQNRFVHERSQCTLEEFVTDLRFDLATMRMVVEHVDDPEEFAESLARLVKPGGHVVVFTVNKYSPISCLSWLLPFHLHHPIKRIFWGGEEEDTFPVQYLMNRRITLRRLFEDAGFCEQAFFKLDDLSTFGNFKILNYLELIFWKVFRFARLGYPEHCLLGVYSRQSTSHDEARVDRSSEKSDLGQV